MLIPRPRFTVRRLMVAVAVVGLLLTIPEGLDHWRRVEFANWARELSKHYEEMAGKESNPVYRRDYAEWQRAMDYYSRHPEENPWYKSWNPWHARTSREAFVGPNGAPAEPGK